MVQTSKWFHIAAATDPRAIGMAELLIDRGHRVTAPPVTKDAPPAELQSTGIELLEEKNRDSVPSGVDELIVDPRDGATSLVESAPPQGTEVRSVSAAISALTKDYRTIGVTGTHGRGTVTSMVAWILEKAGVEPGFIVSGYSHNFQRHGRDRESQWFVLELDEWLGPETDLHCDYVVCNFLELESNAQTPHWRGISEFLESSRYLKEVFINLDCRGNRRLVRQLDSRPTGYGLEYCTEFRAAHRGDDSERLHFVAHHRDREIGAFQLQIPGAYNVVNALGAIAVAQRLNIGTDCIADALASYRGLKNRHSRARGGGVTIVKDSPDRATQIKRVLASSSGPESGRIISIVAPRPDIPQQDYSEALSSCQEVLVAGGFGGPGDDADFQHKFIDALQSRGLTTRRVERPQALVEQIVELVDTGDTVYFFGLDRLLRHADHLRAALAESAGQAPPKGKQPRLDGPLSDGDGDEH